MKHWNKPSLGSFKLGPAAPAWASGSHVHFIGSSVQTAAQTSAPSLNSMNDPMATIESQIRSTSGGQDPAELRDAAASSIRAALSGDPAEQDVANDKAAEALAKAQNIPVEQARSQVAQYQQQYKDALAKAKLQAKQAADATAKTVSRGALLGALALMLGALAAFFAGKVSAVDPDNNGSGASTQRSGIRCGRRRHFG